MTVLALAMLTGAIRYPGYPASQHAAAGIAMMATMQLVWVAVPLGLQLGARRRSAADELPDAGSEHALDMAVSRLRAALPDRALVQTVVRRGYRLNV